MSKYIVTTATPKEIQELDEATQKVVTRYILRKYEVAERSIALEICSHHIGSKMEMEWQGRTITLAVNHGGTIFTNDITAQ